MDVWQAMEATGSLLFILCLVPQFVRTVRRGHADDVSLGFLVLVLLGSVVLVPYTLHRGQWFFAASFGGNVVAWGTVAWYRVRPRTEGARDLPRRLPGDD